MDIRYQEFCLSDPRFYDVPERAGMRAGRFALADAAPPSGWSAHERDGWSYRQPSDVALRPQGWKLHVSSTIGHAERVLGVVADYCVQRRIAFKFLPSASDLHRRNMKYADRSGSGKFITLYPPSDGAAVEAADALDAQLGGTPGPYILSDLRWNSGPVFVRYGAFLPRFGVDDQGERFPAVEDPEGALVPDVREPRFTPPAWVALPAAMRRHLEALGSGSPPAGFPYAVREPLHFSNGGGVYLAEDLRDGRKVVLKEARPHAGLDPSGRDAVERLRAESRFVEMLADEPSVVGWIDAFDLLEHRFLAEEYVDGQTLNKAMVARYPLIRSGADATQIAEYTEWASDVVDQVAAAVGRLHARGLAFGDLHPNNMIVTPENRVVLVDLEMAHEIDAEDAPLMGAPGFAPPDARHGVARDRYGLGCLRLSMFLPLTALLPFDPAKVYEYLRRAEQLFPLGDDFRAAVLSDLGLDAREPDDDHPARAAITAWRDARPTPTASIVEHLAGAVLADATPARTDRLYPGDIAQFGENGLGVARGAAGVLLSLHHATVRVPQMHLDWFADATSDPQRFGPHVGLYDGAAGAALALVDLGMPTEARALAKVLLRLELADCSQHLYGGLAGLGLVHLALAHEFRDERHLERALAAGQQLRTREGQTPDRRTSVSGPGDWAGLLWGRAGHALLHCELYGVTRDDRHLDAARAAISYDLGACVTVPEDGSLQVDEGWRVLPYLATGSAGIGVAILRLREYLVDPDLERSLAGIQHAVGAQFVIGCGQLNGRAGLLEYILTCRDAKWAVPTIDELVDRHRRDLSLHATSGGAGIAMAGDQLLRLSHDLGTGTAGVIHALTRAASRPRPLTGYLPLLSHRISPTHGERG